MSRSAGPGSPLVFRCAGCKKRVYWRERREEGLTHRVEVTGRTKERRVGFGHARGIRNLHTMREYRCLDCGHVGWSSHIDLFEKGKLDERRRRGI